MYKVYVAFGTAVFKRENPSTLSYAVEGFL